MKSAQTRHPPNRNPDSQPAWVSPRFTGLDVQVQGANRPKPVGYGRLLQVLQDSGVGDVERGFSIEDIHGFNIAGLC